MSEHDVTVVIKQGDAEAIPPTAQLLENQAVRARIGKPSNSAFYALIAKGEFPKPLKLGSRSFWLEADVINFIAARAANRSVSKTRRRTRKAGAR